MITPGLSYAEYDALPGLRWSRLKVLATRTPMHFATPAMPNSADPGHSGWLDADEIHDVAADELIRRGVMRGA